MKALVTGAAGFVGHYLLAHLVDSGDETVATDRATGGPDLLDVPALVALLTAERPEVVYHLAGQADVGRSWQEPLATFRANAEGTLNVLAAAREAGVRRVVTVTSADVYGRVSPEDLPLSEQAPLQPVSPYAASKAAADLVAQQAFVGQGQEVIRVRAFNHLGPGQSEQFVCSALAARIARNEVSGEATLRVGDLSAKRDFTDVRDVVRAYRLLAAAGHPGEAYNVCSGVSVSVQSVAEQLLALAHHPMDLVVDQALLRPIDLPDLRGDASKLHSHTGWAPATGLKKSLSDLLEYWRLQISPAE
ncbi:MAG: NAD-dependent epimerase/dehydratase family protein [Actinobacteria bacterium]|nr:NAD-dependent epimerase/dehydratase family protein [Actinomycetota bacterium]